MLERSVTDAAARAIDMMRAHFLALFALGLIAATPSAVLWSALQSYAVSHFTSDLSTGSVLRLVASVAVAALVVLVLLLLLEALMWGAMSEALARAERREPVSAIAALSEAGAKFKRYFASYCAFLVPAAAVDIGALLLLLVLAVVPSLGAGAFVALAFMALVPVYVWANGFVLLLVPAAARGHFGAEGFRLFWHELKHEWLSIAGLQLMIYVMAIGLMIAGAVIKFFLPETQPVDWQKLLDLAQHGGWQQMLPQLTAQTSDWRDWLRDGVDVVRDALLFAFSAALGLCWYAGKPTETAVSTRLK
jgi:hypothetical protein